MSDVDERSTSNVVNEIAEINNHGDCHDNINISRSNDAIKGNEKVVLVRTKLEEAMEARKKKLAMKLPPTKPNIQRVPVVLAREHENNLAHYFEPKWVSIGPIHHGKPHLRLSEDKYKLDFVAKFLEDSGYQSGEALCRTIEEKIEELKKRFDKEVIEGYNNEKLAWMLFVDGCFALQFMHSYVRGEITMTFEIKNDQIAFANRDLLLLENQIPVEVLRLLMGASTNDGHREELKNSIWKFIEMNVVMTQGEWCRKSLRVYEEEQSADHILDLLRLALLQQSSSDLSVEVQKNGDHVQLQRPIFATANDLVEGYGIRLKPSETFSLINGIALPSFNVLQLPPLLIDDSTAIKFLNLIGYEMCPDNFRTRFEVTTYICFMNSLMVYPVDVRVLRSNRILQNFMGSDEKVAQLFNDMAAGLVPNAQFYSHVQCEIDRRRKNLSLIFIMQVKRDYFREPWALPTFLSSIFISVILSLIQTWFTISPPPGPCDNFCHKK